MALHWPKDSVRQPKGYSIYRNSGGKFLQETTHCPEQPTIFDRNVSVGRGTSIEVVKDTPVLYRIRIHI